MQAHVLETLDPTVIGVRLTEARKARGLTQQQVADELGVARTTLTAMEAGERRPRAAELVQLATLYGRNLGELVRAARKPPTADLVVQFRTARTPAGSERDAALDGDIQVFQQLCADFLELEELLSAPLLRRYPEVYDMRGSEPERAAEDVALSERNRLGLGDGPIGDLWSILENDVGLRVFAPAFASPRLAGLFAFSEALGGCIAVNGKHPEERRRMTAAHEYGHFLADRYRAEITVVWSYRRVPESERFAEAFALNFLAPAAGLARRFEALKRARADNKATPADILQLCHVYRMSFQAMTLRLESLKLLASGSWDRLKGRIKPQAARVLLDLPPVYPEHAALPFRYEQLAVRAYARELLSEGRLARMLRTDRLGARRRVEELGVAQFFDERDGEIKQLALDLDAALVSGRA